MAIDAAHAVGEAKVEDEADRVQPARSVSAPQPSKGSSDENFPVGSWLIAPALRPVVAHYYAFARAADDIADDPNLTPDDKIARLDAMDRALTDRSLPVAAQLADDLAGLGVSTDCASDLLIAFRQDARVTRYESWDALLGYCRHSADPVGRFLLSIHRESDAALSASNALCTALQVLNHLQDCGDDRRALDRVYLPLDILAEEGVDVDALDAAAASPGLRRALDRVLDLTEPLIDEALTLPSRLRSRRLAAESAVIARLARRLAELLRRGDPLAKRVALSKVDFARAGALGAPFGWWVAGSRI
ncbi:MAG: squalene synthase HpnC [Pseudomonadota bacterium]